MADTRLTPTWRKRLAAACFAAAVWLSILGGARAGDAAKLDVLGFSDDGSVFVFEEFGVEDGSGFPYSTIYFVDTVRGEWLSGTPVRVVIEDDAAPADRARAESAERAASRLQSLGVSRANATRLAVRRIDADTDAQATEKVYAFDWPSPGSVEYRLVLQAVPAPSRRACAEILDGPARGFVLRLSDPVSGADHLLHSDTTIPGSRGCPLGYDVADVIARSDAGNRPVVVLLAVTRPGFEGPDVRFIAVIP